MVVPQYGSTAHGRAVVRQHGVRQCGSAAVRQKVYCERHTAILVYGRKREVYGALHTTYGSTAYSVWRTAVRRTVAHRGGGRTGRTAYGTRRTAWCTVHSTQPGEQGSDARQQGIRSTRSIPGSKEQTSKQTVPVSVPLSVPFPAEQMLETSQRITGSRPSIKNSTLLTTPGSGCYSTYYSWVRLLLYLLLLGRSRERN